MTPGAERGSTARMPYNGQRRHTGVGDAAVASQPSAAGALGRRPGDRRARVAAEADRLRADSPDLFGQVVNRARQFPADDSQPARQAFPTNHRSPRLSRSAGSHPRARATGRSPEPLGHLGDAQKRLRDARLRGDDGAISITMLFIGMVVIVFVAALIGGGALFAARSTGFDLAQSAARAGAQQIDTATYRATGQLRLDPAKAAQAAKQFLNAAGATGTVEVTAAQITVTATTHQATPMLAMFGFDTVTVTSTASATPTTGPSA